MRFPSALGTPLVVTLTGALLGAALAGCGPADLAESETPFTPEAEAAAGLIDGSTIREVILEIADDRYGGRGPGTEGDRMTRTYLAEQLESIRFEPGAADGGWEQTFELVGLTAAQPATWPFTNESGTVELAQREDFIVASGVQSPEASVSGAELVFVGYGIQAPEYAWDDFKGVDVTGKVLVIINNDPDWDPDLFEGVTRLYYGRWTYKYESAARQGAAGAIIIHTTPSAGYPWQVVQTSWTGEQFELPAADEPHVPIQAWVTEDAARTLIAAGGHDYDDLIARARGRDFEPVPLGVRTSMSLPVDITATETANVLGVLRGSDTELADEYVIYTAHHDHLGTDQGNPAVDPNDRIYNGAMDNATGVGMVLSVGRALASLAVAPRRSIMLLFVGAEEQGLLGSEYFATSPVVAPGRMAANINFDGGNIWGRSRDITFIGLGKSTLDRVAGQVAEYQGRIVKPDEFPDRGYYYRSDQFNFAKIGVPAFFLDGGTEIIGRPEGWGVEQINLYTERDYHQPSDEYRDDWTFEAMADDSQFGFWAGLIVANAAELPAWNPGDEFAAARAAALEAVRGAVPPD